MTWNHVVEKDIRETVWTEWGRCAGVGKIKKNGVGILLPTSSQEG